jgi:Zn finger protein HypA/HybF involved in hydrogenase expression
MMICPKCNKERKRAIQVLEFEAKWWASEGFYVADPDGQCWIKAKCLTCGTELIETKDKEAYKKPSKPSPSMGSVLRSAGPAEKRRQRLDSGPKRQKDEDHMRMCPKCKKKRRKVIQVDESEGSWEPMDGLYIVNSGGISRTYEKCRVCGTIL